MIGSPPSSEMCHLKQCCGSAPGSDAFFDPWIQDPGWKKTGSEIRDKPLGPYFQGLSNSFWLEKYIVTVLKFLAADLDPVPFDPAFGTEKFGSGTNKH